MSELRLADIKCVIKVLFSNATYIDIDNRKCDLRTLLDNKIFSKLVDNIKEELNSVNRKYIIDTDYTIGGDKRITLYKSNIDDNDNDWISTDVLFDILNKLNPMIYTIGDNGVRVKIEIVYIVDFIKGMYYMLDSEKEWR